MSLRFQGDRFEESRVGASKILRAKLKSTMPDVPSTHITPPSSFSPLLPPPLSPKPLTTPVGMNFDVDEGRLEGKLRMKASHATLHLLPEPSMEMRGRWPLGFTNLDVDIRYR